MKNMSIVDLNNNVIGTIVWRIGKDDVDGVTLDAIHAHGNKEIFCQFEDMTISIDDVFLTYLDAAKEFNARLEARKI
ncbi:hypothetical protein KAR91_21205 [Candidatus Pacearchaeota archaeon]|nr:hypothetical protein [Candidatus Pacearchaeota archaeon]